MLTPWKESYDQHIQSEVNFCHLRLHHAMWYIQHPSSLYILHSHCAASKSPAQRKQGPANYPKSSPEPLPPEGSAFIQDYWLRNVLYQIVHPT